MTYTINPNAKNVWIRDNEDTMDLSPITDASSVYLENGRTIEQELGEGSMVSNIATVDNSMTKVIDGTLDGAYESGVLYGRSLVNLFDKTKIQPHSGYSIGEDNTITYLSYQGFGKGVKLNCLKPNTKYALFFNVLSTSLDPDVPYRINDDGTVYGINIFGNKQDAPSSGYHSFITGDNVDNVQFRFYTNERNEGYKLTLPVILEYQEGMENWDIPYFEGICDVKMPILRNVGKNLFDKNTMKTSWWVNQDGVKKGYGNTNYSILVPATQNKVYSVSFDVSNRSRYAFLDKDYNTLLLQTGYVTKTAPQGTKYLLYYLHSENIDLCGDIQLEEATAKTVHEDYKSNILHTPETVTLRSLPNGVRDELNLKTGEYVQRIGEVVLDGSQTLMNFYNHAAVSGASGYSVQVQLNDASSYDSYGSASNKIICDKLQIISHSDMDRTEKYGITQTKLNSIDLLLIKLPHDYSPTPSVTTFKEYLQQNPVTVQYELAEPITTKVTLTQSEPIVKIGTELPNGVCDTYNLLTGEHIQRVGKVVLDGSEAWTKVAFPSTNTTHCYSSLKIENLKMPNVNEKNIVSDRFQTVAQESYNYSNEEMYTWRAGELLYVNILRSRLSTSDVQGLKAWFKENPTTVWYELKNPIVTKKNGLPNTHGVTLPSGVVDKYNESTGVYTQNVGVEYVGDNGTFDNIIQQSNGTRIHYNLGESIRPIRTKVLTDNRFTFKDTWSETHEPYSVFIGNGLDMYFVIPASEGVTTIAQAKDWFEANKTLLYYELATPKTIDIPLINVGQVLPNGVCDTYNPITKEYVKRVSGTVLVGNEDWSLMNSPYETDCIGFVTPYSLANWSQSQANLNIVCEGYVGNYELWNVDEEGFSVFKTPTRLAIKVKRSKLSTADINGFKKFLKLNPLAVWYELATPEVSTVDLDLSTLYSSSPIAYENGHIILESGHDGQSLLPTLEYSTVTNRVKQIESIGEQVLRQEKQLTMLEQMLIQNIVGMDYNNTLLALNLEIDEVM